MRINDRDMPLERVLRASSKGFFHEMVSDALGAEVLGKRSKGTLSPVSPIRCVENKATGPFYKPQDSDAVDVAHPQRRSIMRPTSESTTSGCRI